MPDTMTRIIAALEGRRVPDPPSIADEPRHARSITAHRGPLRVIVTEAAANGQIELSVSRLDQLPPTDANIAALWRAIGAEPVVEESRRRLIRHFVMKLGKDKVQ